MEPAKPGLHSRFTGSPQVLTRVSVEGAESLRLWFAKPGRLDPKREINLVPMVLQCSAMLLSTML